jgi:hypothetical protein
LAYVTRVQEAYHIGKPHVRRLANQCFFEKLLIRRTDDGVMVLGAIYREPWATIFAESFQQRMAENTASPDEPPCGRGSYLKVLVPPAGFEPALLPPEGSALSPELRGP